MTDKVEELIAAGYAARRQRRPDEAKRLFSEALACTREVGPPALLAQALTGLGQMERDLGNGEMAAQHYTAAVAIQRTLDDPLRLAHTVRHVADIQLGLGRLAEADCCYREALNLYRQHEAAAAPLDLANALAGYARLSERQAHSGEALLFWEEARRLYAAENVGAGVAEAEQRLAALRVG